jgi:hypothetical protein
MSETADRPPDLAAAVQAAPETAQRVLRDPRVFFAAMPRTGGYEAPGAFAAVMLVGEGAILAVFALLHLRIGGAVAALVATPIVGAIGLAIGAAIILFVSRALGGQATFESSFRIAAYASVIAPIHAAASMIPYLPLLATAYGIYLLIVAITVVHGINEQTSWTVIGGLGALLLLLDLGATMAARHARPAAEELNRRIHDRAEELKRAADQMQREAERMQREADRGR